MEVKTTNDTYFNVYIYIYIYMYIQTNNPINRKIIPPRPYPLIITRVFKNGTKFYQMVLALIIDNPVNMKLK